MYIYYSYLKGKWIDDGANDDDIGVNDYDDADTTAVIGEDSDDDEVDVNKKNEGKKIITLTNSQWFFKIISTISQKDTWNKKNFFYYVNKFSNCAYLLCVICRMINLSFYKKKKYKLKYIAMIKMFESNMSNRKI